MLSRLEAAGYELIDTCWNVNIFVMLLNMLAALELIDTCWNVNISTTLLKSSATTELIDTCWNVNTWIADATVASRLGINRYMLECKSSYAWHTR